MPKQPGSLEYEEEEDDLFDDNEVDLPTFNPATPIAGPSRNTLNLIPSTAYASGGPARIQPTAVNAQRGEHPTPAHPAEGGEEEIVVDYKYVDNLRKVRERESEPKPKFGAYSLKGICVDSKSGRVEHVADRQFVYKRHRVCSRACCVARDKLYIVICFL